VNKWRCPAIETGIAIYDNNVIRPCCKISWDYYKPIESIKDSNRFIDLYQDDLPPTVCSYCTQAESKGLDSYRQSFLKLEKQKTNTKSIQFLDFKHSNFCNAKCRICTPHHSHLWDKELNNVDVIRQSNIDEYLDMLVNSELIEIYFSGGEPLIIKDHYIILKRLIKENISQSVNLRYSSNLSTLSYKNTDIFKLWKQFKSVQVSASAEGIKEMYNNMRSGLDWNRFEKNLQKLSENNISFSIAFTLNNLNIWFLNETLTYFKSKQWNYSISVIEGPADFTLKEIPNHIKEQALSELKSCYDLIPKNIYNYIAQEIESKETGGFTLNINDQKHYDTTRNENLVELLSNIKVLPYDRQ
jgi:sulfatase maturation enzyme AslB (radical SAM superfamily)